MSKQTSHLMHCACYIIATISIFFSNNQSRLSMKEASLWSGLLKIPTPLTVLIFHSRSAAAHENFPERFNFCLRPLQLLLLILGSKSHISVLFMAEHHNKYWTYLQKWNGFFVKYFYIVLLTPATWHCWPNNQTMIFSIVWKQSQTWWAQIWGKILHIFSM